MTFQVMISSVPAKGGDCRHPRREDCEPDDGGEGETVPGSDLQHSTEGLLLQRDPQQASGARYHLCPVHPGTAGDTQEGGGHAHLIQVRQTTVRCEV